MLDEPETPLADEEPEEPEEKRDDFPAPLNGLDYPYTYFDLRPEVDRAWDRI